MATEIISCPHCHHEKVYSHGRSQCGKHRKFQCQSCRRVFQRTYTYEAKKPGVKERIVDMAFNGGGVRDTARVLKIGVNTVIRTLKKNSRHSGSTRPPPQKPGSP